MSDAWTRYRDDLWHDDELGIRLDLSRTASLDDLLAPRAAALSAALSAMAELEAGALANPDEGRRVGHYWLRDPDRAPEAEGAAVRETVGRVRAFARTVHAGTVRPPVPGIDRFTRLLVVGIGGSALGPQLVADALGTADDALVPHFLDNTDPDGFDRVFQALDGDLARTLVLVVSKSGGTKETRNGMFETQAAFDRMALDFPRYAVAVTGEGSALHDYARDTGFLEIFPMWDWVGGRTSVTSAVGLLPAALQGVDIDAFLEGARLMDGHTRAADARANPAARLAAAWHHATGGAAERAMVVLPYKDRLALLGRYLQQLVMESLGKERNLAGETVRQGLTVYGNKGSTDQHAFVQQLREGPDDCFVTFVSVDRDRRGSSPKVEESVTSGDYLLGFLLGTRDALSERGRMSQTLGLPDVSPRTLGAVIALYERTVGLYAHLVGINAYHQPGVEAGKTAAGEVLALQRRLLAALREDPREFTVEELAAAAGGDPETVHAVLVHLAANPDHGVAAGHPRDPARARFRRADAVPE